MKKNKSGLGIGLGVGIGTAIASFIRTIINSCPCDPDMDFIKAEVVSEALDTLAKRRIADIDI